MGSIDLIVSPTGRQYESFQLPNRRCQRFRPQLP